MVSALVFTPGGTGARYSPDWPSLDSRPLPAWYDEAKLGVFQQVDAPTPAGSRGLREFLANVDDDTFEDHRRRLKETTGEDVKRVAEKYLNNSSAPRGMTVIGPADKKEVDDSWTVQELV